MNHSLLLSLFLLFLLDLGRLGIAPSFWTWQGNCGECGKMVKNPKGIFCANFVHSRGPWPPCHQAWCGKCYKASVDYNFHIDLPENDFGNVHRKKKDEKHFLVGHNGDHLIQPFQCDLCWFRNLTRRNPCGDNEVDLRLLAHIRRVNLDMFWSREPATVRNQITSYNKSVGCDLSHGLVPSFPVKGPWRIGDDV